MQVGGPIIKVVRKCIHQVRAPSDSTKASRSRYFYDVSSNRRFTVAIFFEIGSGSVAITSIGILGYRGFKNRGSVTFSVPNGNLISTLFQPRRPGHRASGARAMA